MESGKLVKNMIGNPRVWRLALRVEADALRVVLYSTVEDNSLIYRTIPLDPAAPSHLRAVEDAVYDNPLLLSDFERVYCVVDNSTFLLVPTPLAETADDCELMLKAAFPDFEGEIVSNPTGAANATLLTGLDSDLAAFLNRTFLSPRLFHHLSPLCRYFITSAGKGNSVKTHVNLRPRSLDIIVSDHGNLLMANTFAYSSINDALYYVMACREYLGIGPGGDELLLAGDPKAREVLMPRLRDYVARVMPVIFPSRMFAAGRDSMQAPFDLIVLPLCE